MVRWRGKGVFGQILVSYTGSTTVLIKIRLNVTKEGPLTTSLQTDTKPKGISN